jgi:hypothetical protein
MCHRMDELLYREEMMWLQRSRIVWLKEGDRNTKYFHHKAAARAKKNKIKRSKGDDGRTTHDKKEMETLATKIFRTLYTTDPTVHPEDVVLFQIGPLKAPGPDGFPDHFFSKELGDLER